MTETVSKAMLALRRAFENALSKGSDLPPAPGIEVKASEFSQTAAI